MHVVQIIKSVCAAAIR